MSPRNAWKLRNKVTSWKSEYEADASFAGRTCEGEVGLYLNDDITLIQLNGNGDIYLQKE